MKSVVGPRGLRPLARVSDLLYQDRCQSGARAYAGSAPGHVGLNGHAGTAEICIQQHLWHGQAAAAKQCFKIPALKGDHSSSDAGSSTGEDDSE